MRRITPNAVFTVLALALLLVCGASMLGGYLDPPEPAAPETVDIDWRARYPFPGDRQGSAAPAAYAVPAGEGRPSVLERVDELLRRFEEFQNELDGAKSQVFGYQRYLELVGAFRRITGQTRTGAVVLLNNGYLTSIVEPADPEEAQTIADSVIRFKDATQAAGVPLLYVQEPQKVSPTDDQMPFGEMSYINYNLDDHLARLTAGGVDTFDLRAAIQKAGLDHYGLFFRTDHHWTMDSGLWAARALGEELNARYGLGLDLSLLAPEKFERRTYEDWYLGGQGRYVTAGYIRPDDFSIVLPDYDTAFTVEHPDRGVSLTGDFYETMFDVDMLNTRDLYDQSTYESILYGNRPLTTIVNHNNPEGPDIMLVHDSYATAVAPFLALMCRRVDLLDVRDYNGNFYGSLDAYRDEMDPDLVLLMYCSPVNIDRSGG